MNDLNSTSPPGLEDKHERYSFNVRVAYGIILSIAVAVAFLYGLGGGTGSCHDGFDFAEAGRALLLLIFLLPLWAGFGGIVVWFILNETEGIQRSPENSRAAICVLFACAGIALFVASRWPCTHISW